MRDTSSENNVLGFLKAMSSMGPPQEGWSFSSLESLLLTKGVSFEAIALPYDVERGMMKECYKNAALLSFERSDLRYCEGYAAGIIPVMHAWCIDSKNRVIDPTWPDAESCIYHGVAFKSDWARKFMIKNKLYGVFGGEFNRAYPLMQDSKKLDKALENILFPLTGKISPQVA